ncbi:hypothetical protein [Chryseobacterium sp.]|uniref:hypothetical protein n=1 Tax=Chryseobacterium sp. TaxID=1871047 RepID=UPI0028A141D3|nr:hypothetical protein [Chryseobacterium sp.]
MKNILFLFQLLFINTMAQNNYKIVKTNYDANNFESIRNAMLEYDFYAQDQSTHRLCLKHKTKSEYKIVTDDSKNFFLVFNNEKDAMDILHSQESISVGDIETDYQEEIEKITSENIAEKSKEFLKRFNENFKLDVSYDPTEGDIDKIDEKVKKTVWNKENRFLLNFYMMEVTKRKFNFDHWYFEQINTFNPFFVPQYIGRDQQPSSYYNLLETNKRNFFDFRLYVGLVSPKDAPSLNK